MLKTLKKLLYLLPAKDKGKLFILCGMMIFGSALEVIGIGLLPAFVSIIATPERVLEIELLQPLWVTLGISDGGDLLMWGSATLITVFFLKNVYMVFYYFIEARFIHNRYAYLGAELYKKYMKAPFTFHLERNSSVLLRNITQETKLLLTQVMTPLMLIAKDVVMITAIVLFLLAIEPLITVVAMSFLGGVGYVFLKLLKNKMRSYGKQAQKDRQLMIQDVQEGVGGMKEVSILNREGSYIRRFTKNIQSYAHSQAFKTVASRSGKPVMETIAVAGMLMIAVILYVQGRGLEVVLPVLTLFGAATIRLLPSTQEMINAINQLRYYVHTIKPIYDDMRRLSSIDEKQPVSGKSPFCGWQNISMKNVTYRYPGSAEKAVKNLNLEIRKGNAVGFVGTSGAGKTTLVDMLLGLLEPEEGEIAAGDENIYNSLAHWQAGLGYIPQSIFLADNTIRRNITLGMDEQEIDEELINDAVEAAQLGELIERLDNGVDTIIGEGGVRLSGGQRQRIGIARALYHNPEVLIMDEATSALDNITEKYIIEAVERLKGERTIIMIAHRLTTVKNCDNIYMMNEGEITEQGTYDELLEYSEEFRRMSLMD